MNTRSSMERGGLRRGAPEPSPTRSLSKASPWLFVGLLVMSALLSASGFPPRVSASALVSASPAVSGAVDTAPSAGASLSSVASLVPPEPSSASARFLADPVAWPAATLKAVGQVIVRADGGFEPGDILSFYAS
ncbi:MAG: hypothetical protein V2A71_07245, partial [Candidatus Eisenbacteria bacterium]